MWMGALVAIVVLFAPAVFSSDAFDPKWLNWIGFFRITPETADLAVPVFPWFGVVLVGMLGMRVLRNMPAFTWSSPALPVRAIALFGRWSLLFYLVHQPILFGIVTPIANWVDTAEQTRIESFVNSCNSSCLQKNPDARFCTAYCQCALDMTVTGNLWNATEDKLTPMSKLCTQMAK